MNDCYAVLLDIVGIQNYIFRSNKLKENLGASYLLQDIYSKCLASALCEITNRPFEEELQHLNDWKKSNANAPDCNKTVDIGYIGGGNALLFFPNEEFSKQFITRWTKYLLINTPGLTTAVASEKFPETPEQYSQALKSLFKKLNENKNKHIPITSLPRHGITAECARSEFSAEIFNHIPTVKDYVSADVNARLNAAEVYKKEIGEKYKSLLKNDYCFTDELDELGSIKEEDSHIAIVHIDGNEIGKLVRKAKDLQITRYLSKTIFNATETAFDAVIETTVKKYDEIMSSLGFQSIKDVPMEKGKKILPIRPIILGGDDVTFVCNGKLGIYFAKLFIEEFEKTKINDSKITACAGVSIIKTKYPFYRGYWLAEELCANAKKKRKHNDENASYLDFHIAMSGVAGDLSEIRQRFFGIDPRDNAKTSKPYLLYRPFKIVAHTTSDELSLDLFLRKIGQLIEPENGLAKNKLNDLQNVLTLSEDAWREYVLMQKYRGNKLPNIEGHQYEETLFENNITPYFDMLEIARFYPQFALKEIGVTND